MSGRDRTTALLTARGSGAIAVLSLHGADRLVQAQRLLQGASVDGVPRRRWLMVDGERIDEALVFTREDQGSIELHVHGSPAVLSALERVLGPLSPPPATARERLLATSASTAQLDFALEQSALLAPHGGDFACWVAAHASAPAELRTALAGHVHAVAMATPMRLVLVGRKNAGKSTLMNRLMFRERVLTGPTPGLTRDPVCDSVELDGYPYELVDTAGEGEAVDDLDRQAMARGRAARGEAAPVLVVDAPVGVQALERALMRQHPNALVVRNRTDLGIADWPTDLSEPAIDLSCRAPSSAARVRAAFGAVVRSWRRLPPAGPAGAVVAVDAVEAALLRAALDAPPAA